MLQPVASRALAGFFDSLRLFGIGLSWGGFESLALPIDRPVRTVRPWTREGPLIRIHAGLESGDDLVADMVRALDGLRAGTSASEL